jgi:hypothetical protein
MIPRTAATHLSRYLGVTWLLLQAPNARAQDAPAPVAAAPTETTRILPAASAEPGVKAFLARHSDALGRRCTLRAAAASGALRFLACGSAGLWICRLFPDGTATLLGEQDVTGSATGFFLQDGKLWIEISSVRAQRIALPNDVEPPLADATATPVESPRVSRPVAPPSAAAVQAVAPLPRPKAPARTHFEAGRVVRVETATVIVTMGAASLASGDRVVFYEQGVQSDDRMQVGGAPEPLAIGQVVDVNEVGARVQLGMNEIVPIGSRAERSSLPLTASSFAPRRVGGVWDVAFVARPFIVLENFGVGGFVDARAGYHMRAPVHFEASISPLGFATARDGVIVPVAALLSASYDSPLFEIGLGFGGQTVKTPDISLEPGSGSTLAQRLRLGARDGAHIEALSYVTLFHSQFDFSTIRIQGQIPVGRRSWLLAAGGGGTVGLAYGEVGLRVLLSGNGGPDSFFLTTVIGGVNVFNGCVFDDSGQCQAIDYVGPMLGVGGEWRL